MTRANGFAALCRWHGARLQAGDETLDQFRQALCGALVAHFRVSRASLWRCVGESPDQRLHCVGVGLASGGAEGGGAVLHEAEFGAYLRELLGRGVYTARDVLADPALSGLQAYFASTGVRSLLDTAFQINGRPFGVLCLEVTGQPRAWTAREAQQLRAAASAISLVVARLGPGYDFGVS